MSSQSYEDILVVQITNYEKEQCLSHCIHYFEHVSHVHNNIDINTDKNKVHSHDIYNKERSRKNVWDTYPRIADNPYLQVY